MNENELRERFQNLERQVFGMTHEKYQELRNNLTISPEVVKKIHDNVLKFDPKGSRFVYRVRQIQCNYGLSDGQMMSVFGTIKAVYENRTDDLYSIKPAMVDYPKLMNSFWDELITSFDAIKLGYELDEIKQRLDTLETIKKL